MSGSDPAGLRLALGLAVGAVAAGTAAFVAVEVEPLQGLVWYAWVSAWAALGSGLAASGQSGWVGRPGWKGWARAFAAAVLCTLWGSLSGGTMAFPGYGTILGALVALATIFHPKGMPLWWGGFVLVQLLALWLRARAGFGRA